MAEVQKETCPSCSRPLEPGQSKCPQCGCEFVAGGEETPAGEADAQSDSPASPSVSEADSKDAGAPSAEEEPVADSDSPAPLPDSPEGGRLRHWILAAAGAASVALLALFPVGLASLGLSWVTGTPWADGLLAAAPLSVAVWGWAFRIRARLRAGERLTAAPAWLIALTALSLAPAAPVFLVILYGLLREGPARPMDIARGLAFGLGVFAAASVWAMASAFARLERDMLAKWAIRSLWGTRCLWGIAWLLLFFGLRTFWLTGAALLGMATVSLALSLALRSRGAAAIAFVDVVAFLACVLVLSLVGAAWGVQFLILGVLLLTWWPLRGLSRWGVHLGRADAESAERIGQEKYDDFVQRLDFLSPDLRDNLRALPTDLRRAMLPPRGDGDEEPVAQEAVAPRALKPVLIWEGALLALIAFWALGSATGGVGVGVAWLLLGGVAAGAAGGFAMNAAIGSRLPKERFTLLLGSALGCPLALALAALAIGVASPYRFMSAAVWFYSILLGAATGLAVNRARGAQATRQALVAWGILWFFGGVAAWAAMSVLWFAGLFVFCVLGGVAFGFAQRALADFAAFVGRARLEEDAVPPAPPYGACEPPSPPEPADEEPLDLPEDFERRDDDA